jgi:hypothetical protein
MSDRYDDLGVHSTEEGFNLIWRIQIIFEQSLAARFLHSGVQPEVFSV